MLSFVLLLLLLTTSLDADTYADNVGVMDQEAKRQTRISDNNDATEALLDELPQYTKAALPTPCVVGRLAEVTDNIRGVWRCSGAGGWASITGRANVQDFGAIPGDRTDDTVAIQAAFDAAASSGSDPTVFAPAGRYIIGGALRDTRESNVQLVLPKRNTLADQLTFRLLGETPAPTFGRGNLGTVFESTLASGTGAIVGVKNNSSSGGVASIVSGANFLVFHAENITFRTVENPTLTGLDLRYLPNITLRNVKVDVNYSGPFPSEPKTPTSYGIKTPLNNIPAVAILDNVQVTGFYWGYQWGELVSGNNVTANFCQWVAEIPHALHPLHFGRVLRTECKHGLKFTGGNSTISIEQFDIDNNTSGSRWYSFVDHITDPSNYAHGVLNWHSVTQDVGPGHVFIQDGGFYLWTPQLMQDASVHAASPVVQVHNNANISIPNNTLTNVTFNTNVSNDHYAMHSTSSNTDRFVCKKEGIVHLSFAARFASNATGVRQSRVYKHSDTGGEILLDNLNWPLTPGFPTTVTNNVISGCTQPGDYFYIQVWQNSGGPLNLLTSDYDSPRATFHVVR